jgi:hypothetical protein
MLPYYYTLGHAHFCSLILNSLFIVICSLDGVLSRLLKESLNTPKINSKFLSAANAKASELRTHLATVSFFW